MSSSPTWSIRWAPIVGILVGVVGLMIAVNAEAFRPYGIPFTIATTVIGGVAAYNHRRERVNFVIGLVAAGFGAASTIALLVASFV